MQAVPIDTAGKMFPLMIGAIVSEPVSTGGERTVEQLFYFLAEQIKNSQGNIAVLRQLESIVVEGLNGLG